MSLTATHGSDRERLAGAARAFEAIFIRQMLSAARQARFGENLFGSQAMQTFRQMQDEKLADIAATRGAFGIARMIEAQLTAQAGRS
jgi:flagellar protein FlgJ